MPSKISKPVCIRLKNEQIDVIDKIVEFGDFPNRNEAMRALLMPSLKAFAKVMETKSVTKGLIAHTAAMLELKKILEKVEKKTEIQENLELEIPGLQTEMI